jgi:hypothetical protein
MKHSKVTPEDHWNHRRRITYSIIDDLFMGQMVTTINYKNEARLPYI